MEMIILKGAYKGMGYELGTRLSKAVAHNITLQNKNILIKDINEDKVHEIVNRYTETVTPFSVKLIEGISRGSGIPFDMILRYNALQDI